MALTAKVRTKLEEAGREEGRKLTQPFLDKESRLRYFSEIVQDVSHALHDTLRGIHSGAQEDASFEWKFTPFAYPKSEGKSEGMLFLGAENYRIEIHRHLCNDDGALRCNIILKVFSGEENAKGAKPLASFASGFHEAHERSAVIEKLSTADGTTLAVFFAGLANQALRPFFVGRRKQLWKKGLS